jgi:hypothetical protein
MKAALKRIPGLQEAIRFLRGQPRNSREYVLSKMPKGSVGCEIGVHEGEYSRMMLDVIRPSRLHLIDPWKHEGDAQYQQSYYGGLGPDGQAVMDARYGKVRERFAKELASGQIVIHRGFSTDFVGEFADRYFDWVYIDGNHLYEFVKQDLELYAPKVKPGGYLVGDDYGVEGWWKNGVQKAVDEFAKRTPGVTLEVKGHQFLCRKGA